MLADAVSLEFCCETPVWRLTGDLSLSCRDVVHLTTKEQ